MAALTDNIFAYSQEEKDNQLLESQGAKDRAVRNEAQEQKRTERLGRRAYRAAMRGKDPSRYLAGLEALERVRSINGDSGAGIRMAGTREAGIRSQDRDYRARVDSYNGQNAPPGAPGSTQQGPPDPRTAPLTNGATPGTRGRPLTDSVRTANPNATAGAGRGRPINQDRAQAQRDAQAATGSPPAVAQGPGTPGDGLSQRNDLFSRMVNGASVGGNLEDFRQEAASLGIDDAGFDRGLSRAVSAGEEINPAMRKPQPPPSPFSSELNERVRAFSQRNSGLLSQSVMTPVAAPVAPQQPDMTLNTIPQSARRGPFGDLMKSLNLV